MTQEDERADAVRDVVAGVAHHIDAKRWKDLVALYADQVHTDYTSLFGGAPQQQAREELIGVWRNVLQNVQTQHLLGPVTVEFAGATATARCHVRAFHRAAGAPSGQDWEVLGHYVFTFQSSASGWRISAMRLETLLQTGNTRLLEEASTAAANR